MSSIIYRLQRIIMEYSVCYDRKHRFANGLKFGGWIILGVGAAVLFAFLFGYFVMLLWNWLMPVLFGLGVINYWQAFGIIVLARLIFGTLGGHKNRDIKHPKPPFMNKHFRKNGQNFRRWRHYDQYWKEEGDEAFERYVERKNAEKQDKQGEEE